MYQLTWTSVTVPCRYCHGTGHAGTYHARNVACFMCGGRGTAQSARLTSVPADAAALPVADGTPTTEPPAVTGGTAEHRR